MKCNLHPHIFLLLRVSSFYIHFSDPSSIQFSVLYECTHDRSTKSGGRQQNRITMGLNAQFVYFSHLIEFTIVHFALAASLKLTIRRRRPNLIINPVSVFTVHNQITPNLKLHTLRSPICHNDLVLCFCVHCVGCVMYFVILCLVVFAFYAGLSCLIASK